MNGGCSIFALQSIQMTPKNFTMDFLSALQTNDTTTTNGMVASSSSLNECVNLFFQIGALRGKDKQLLINTFVKAFNEDQLTAMKLLFWGRDIRGGAGERQIFRDIVKYLAAKQPTKLAKNLYLFPEYGRWDDLLELIGTSIEAEALTVIKKGLEDNNGLCAKWMPRPNIGNRERKKQANTLRNFLKLTPKAYRKMLVERSSTVEQLMCSKNWDAIEYSKLPSKAMSDYMKAFSKNDLARFQAYLTSLEKGETKINAGAVYPYDIVKNMKQGNNRGADAQWKALPNYMEGANERMIPVVDVSGSMCCMAGGNPLVTCMDVAISLGLYISERNLGYFKDAFITFSSTPQVQVLKGSLTERYNQLQTAQWSLSTSIERVFNLILTQSVKNNVPQELMPTMILILSDMQFDRGINDSSLSAQQMFEKKFAVAGYELPKIVYWNLNGANNNFPVKFDENGTALVSGFSPALLTSLLAGKDLSPVSMMNTVINSKRYELVTI